MIKQLYNELASQYKTRSRRVRTFLFLVLILTIVVFAGAVAYNAMTSPRVARLFFLPVPVAGYRVQVGQITDVVGASGVVQEHASIFITSRVNATVKNVQVKIGDVITRDTPLLEADQSAYGPALVAAQQAEVAAKAEVEKANDGILAAQDLKKAGLAADVDLLNAVSTQATARQAEAQTQKALAEAQSDFDFTGFKSPADSIVIESSVNPGDTLIVNRPVFTLGVLDTVYFVALVQESELPFLVANAKAEVIYSSLPSQTFHGVIEKIDPTIDPTTRTFKAYVAIDNPGLHLKPGLTGFGRITLSRTALAIPETSVMNQYGETANVFVVNSDGRAVLTPVVLGLSGQNNYEVVSGLKEGDVVVSAGTIYLRDNERVRVTFPNAKS